MSKAPEHARRALGKGLSALIPTRPTAQPPEPAPPATDHVAQLSIEQIEPNPLQPRRVFQTERLEELAQSIRSNGIIQPLVVRRNNGRYQLVAGERRWRAAKLAGMAQVPVIVQEFPDDRLLEITLIENIQREDLNAIETALAFERLGKELHLSHEEIGQRTGKDRTTITNLLRLLNLPPDLQQLVAERRLSSGHARCLLSLPTAALQREVAEKSVAQGWSVRQMERLTQRMLETRQPKHV
ncbi:MAG TPA: ParB/RepB/Spo0J family partition protein, partial [Bryobacteraceae bacterium]|nr:ParB/RepB/Spo0J family partition protein [Bryobacteraceae bacterium]